MFTRKPFAWRNALSGLREALRQERDPDVDIALRVRLKAWRHGFLSPSWRLYGFGDRPDRDYLPDLPHLLLARRINRDQQVFQNKILFPAVFGALLDIPENLCLVQGDRVQPLPGSGAGITDLPRLLEHVRKHGAVVWKPLQGMGGQAVRVLSFEPASGSWRSNGEAIDESAIVAWTQTRGDYLVCTAIQQGDYARAIFPGSVNTVRINVMIDPASGRAFLASAVHRFGTRASAPVDNWAAGGLVAPIDLERGVLQAATAKPRAGRVQWQDHHPDTGARIEGVSIPRWSAIVERLLEVTESYRSISHSGWDVVVREHDFSVLEGNNHPTLTMLQLTGGVLRDERVRRFYRHHEVIKA